MLHPDHQAQKHRRQTRHKDLAQRPLRPFQAEQTNDHIADAVSDQSQHCQLEQDRSEGEQFVGNTIRYMHVHSVSHPQRLRKTSGRRSSFHPRDILSSGYQPACCL